MTSFNSNQSLQQLGLGTQGAGTVAVDDLPTLQHDRLIRDRQHQIRMLLDDDGAQPLFAGAAGNGAQQLFDDDGRPMVFINWNTDMGDGWEWSNAEEYPGYLKYTSLAYRMGINEVIYALTH